MESASKVNALGEPTAYALEPGDDGVPRQRPDFPALQRAPFAQHPFWVTLARDAEQYAAGDYPNQGRAGDGLTALRLGARTSTARTSSCGTRSRSRTTRASRTTR